MRDQHRRPVHDKPSEALAEPKRRESEPTAADQNTSPDDATDPDEKDPRQTAQIEAFLAQQRAAMGFT